MIEFKPVRLEDRAVIERYTMPSGICNCDLAFANMYCWQEVFHSAWAEIDGFLVIRFQIDGGERIGYMQPVGTGDLGAIIPSLREDAHAHGQRLRIIGLTDEGRETIFVFVADHVSSEKFAEKTRSYPGNMHIVGFIHTPDGALQGEVREVTQQLDIMPTVLGLTGNTEPYFAFGRDVLNEPQRPRWSVSYDGKFRALTDDGAVVLDDSGTEVQECPATPAADSLTQSFRALIQQYYSHIERKSYTPND